MSLILDALKRAERERRAEPMAGVEVPTLSKPRGRRLWLRVVGWAIVALVVIVVALVAARVVKNRRAARPAGPPAPVTQRMPQQASPQTGSLSARPAPTPAPAAPLPAPTKPATAIPGTESVSSLDELSEPESTPMVLTPAPSRLPPQATAAPAPSAPAQPETAQPGPSAQPAAPAPEPKAETPEREVPAALTQPAPLRKLREMPPEFRADVPPLNVQVHVYEKDAGSRFVIVGDRRYKEGETLAEGPRLVEIVREGLVLEFRGEKFVYTLNR